MAYVVKLVGLAVGHAGFMKVCLKSRGPVVSACERCFGGPNREARFNRTGIFARFSDGKISA